VIEAFIDQATEHLRPGWELLIVDDGSADRTREIVTARQGDPRIRLLTHPHNQGLGAALKTGFANARGEFVITIDADLSHPFELIQPFLEAMASADVVLASRYVAGGAMVGLPWRRALISRVANSMLRLLFRIPVHDLTTGYRAYRRSALQGINLIGTGFETQLELTVKLARVGARMVEIPLVLRQRAAGASKMRYTRLIGRYGRMLFRLMLRR